MNDRIKFSGVSWCRENRGGRGRCLCLFYPLTHPCHKSVLQAGSRVTTPGWSGLSPLWNAKRTQATAGPRVNNVSLVSAFQRTRNRLLVLDPVPVSAAALKIADLPPPFSLFLPRRPRFFCAFCDSALTHDSENARKQHRDGFKHKVRAEHPTPSRFPCSSTRRLTRGRKKSKSNLPRRRTFATTTRSSRRRFRKSRKPPR